MIETARLRLRHFSLDDIDAYYEAIISDGDVMRYLPAGEARPKDYAERFIRHFLDHWAKYGFGMWAVILKADTTFIGHCGLNTIPNSTEIEVAYALAKPYWGQGLASEGARAALRYGFETVGLEQIVAVAIPENIASRKVMTKIGMTYEGIKPVYDTELPYYTLRREQFQPGDAPYKISD
jgi:ribosomal-protein-alanine N-acetyltransferase